MWGANGGRTGGVDVYFTFPPSMFGELTRIWWECRELKKKLHIILHCLALVLVIIAVIAVFKSHSLKQPAPTPDLYSLHSWLGILTLSVLGQQVCLSADIAGIRVLT